MYYSMWSGPPFPPSSRPPVTRLNRAHVMNIIPGSTTATGSTGARISWKRAGCHEDDGGLVGTPEPGALMNYHPQRWMLYADQAFMNVRHARLRISAVLRLADTKHPLYVSR